MSEENIAIVRRAAELYNEGGVNNLANDELFSDDVEFHEPPEQPAPRVAKGREAVRDGQILKWQSFWDRDSALKNLEV